VEIEQVAVQRLAKAAWWRLDSPRRIEGKRGVSYDELFDDEWLPVHPPLLQQIDPNRKQLVQAALLGDRVGIEQLATSPSKLKKEDLSSALFAASLGEDSCSLKLLLTLGADANARSEEDDSTPLMQAAGSGLLKNIEVLLEAGADVNAKTRLQWTALHLASNASHFEVVKALLDQGANVHVQDDMGKTPTQLALGVAIVRLLAEYGAHGV